MPYNFTAVIVDDEPIAIKLLQAILNKLYTNIDVVNTFSNGREALKCLQQKDCDLLFLDIVLPGITGFSLLHSLPETDAEVIFVTAYPEYALNAFQFTPTGYILKPIDEKDLMKTVDKAIERIVQRKHHC